MSVSVFPPQECIRCNGDIHDVTSLSSRQSHVKCTDIFSSPFPPPSAALYVVDVFVFPSCFVCCSSLQILALPFPVSRTTGSLAPAFRDPFCCVSSIDYGSSLSRSRSCVSRVYRCWCVFRYVALAGVYNAPPLNPVLVLFHCVSSAPLVTLSSLFIRFSFFFPRYFPFSCSYLHLSYFLSHVVFFFFPSITCLSVLVRFFALFIIRHSSFFIFQLLFLFSCPFQKYMTTSLGVHRSPWYVTTHALPGRADGS